MNCAESRQLADAYVDGELELTGCLEFEQHLAGCPACEQHQATLKLLGAQIRIEAPRYTAPVHLRDHLLAGLPAAIGPAGRPVRSFSVARPVVALAFGALLGWLAWLGVDRYQQTPEVVDSAVAAHVRSLHADTLATVASTNQHTVKPWLTSRLDFAAPVVDLSTQGFELVGGRVDHVARQTVAALVYKRREHVINLFVWPAGTSAFGGQADPVFVVERGFNVVRWTEQGMTVAAVSDLNRDEMKVFAQHFAAGH